MVQVGGIFDDDSHPAHALLVKNAFEGDNYVLVIHWAVFTTRWSALQSNMEQLPYHTEMQFVSMLWMIQWWKSTSIQKQR